MIDLWLRLASICLAGTATAFLVVAKFVYAPLRNVEEEEEPMPFEWRFLEELEALAPRELNADELRGLSEREVDVETPDGRVIMTYDDESQSFVYYTDQKVVEFKHLDAVARQFAFENDAKEICVNYGYAYVTMEEKPESTSPQREVFVSPKKRTTKPKQVKVTNRFSHRGRIEQKWTVVDSVTPVGRDGFAGTPLTFAQFKKKCVDNA